MAGGEKERKEREIKGILEPENWGKLAPDFDSRFGGIEAD